MTPAERRLANEQCERIADEKDYFLIQQRVEHLDELPEREQQRLTNQSVPKPPVPDWQRAI